MEIVPATLDDAEELTRVEIQSKLDSIPECVDPVEVDFERRLERWRGYILVESSPRFAGHERVVFKAVVGRAMVGFIASHLTTRHGRESEIQSFYVLKEHQRAGVGLALLLQFEDWLTEHRVKSLCVGIALENPYQRFYLKNGGRHLNPHWIVWDHLPDIRPHGHPRG